MFGNNFTVTLCLCLYCDVILLHYNQVVLLRHKNIIYLVDVVTFFDNFRITLYFGTFELRMEITF